MKTSDRVLFVIGLVLLFAGLDLTILLSHMSRLVGIALLAAGLGLLFWSVRSEAALPVKKPVKGRNIAAKLIDMLTLQGRLRAVLPVAGLAVIAAVVLFNLVVRDEFYLGSNDYVALFLAGTLVAYNYIPAKYAVERDFAMLFSILLFLLLVIPTTMLSTGDSGGADTNTPLTYYLLVMPTAALVRLMGVDVVAPVHNVITDTYLYNQMEIPGPDGFPISLSIALSCSGLYSVAIFVSAFIAFVAVEYRKFDRVVATLLMVGIALAWIANILRMCIIVLVGTRYGAETMEWVHNNIGELIFMAWVTVFWLFMFRRFGILDGKKPAEKKKEEPRKGLCRVCGGPLSPTIPSRKCECGTITHTGCLESGGGKCPVCGDASGLAPTDKT